MEEDFSLFAGAGKDMLVRLAISTGIGFLIGLEREYHKQVKENNDMFAGVRTYPLVAIFGYLSAFLSLKFGAWVFAVALFCLVGLVAVSYIMSVDRSGVGGTSEISIILTFLLGAIVFTGFIFLALCITVIVLVLLTLKPSLHSFAARLTRKEIHAFIQFIVISALVLPFLPDETFGPYDAWNLKDIWKMVILVSGISLAGYLLSKTLGDKKGTLVGGIVGGIVSSTATSLSLSRRSRENPSIPAIHFAVGIIAASTIMFPRVLIEVYAINPALVMHLWIPMAIICAAGALAAFLIYKKAGKESDGAEMKLRNPLNFNVAIQFALIYAAILWLVKFASDRFGDTGIYIASVISGLTDMDAISISMAKMSRSDQNYDLATNAILLAAMSNTLVKFGIALVVGSVSLRKTVSFGFGAILLSSAGWLVWRMML